MIHFIKESLRYKDRQTLEIEPFYTEFTNINSNSSSWILCNGEYSSATCTMSGIFAAVANTDFKISGHGIVIKTPGYSYTETIFNRIDPKLQGHLSYIDGCSNTGLIGPLRNGDPCINYLYFPSNTLQTMHTHPSCRIGMILDGHGIADVEGTKINLNVGDIFLLERMSRHRFITTATNMSLIVFHPDSEDGPRDEHNPMKSRTYF